MKKITYSLSTIVICGLLVSCSDSPTKSVNEVVETEISNEELKIFNKSDNDIFYFVIERDFATMANWSPNSREENRIQPKSGKNISLSGIPNYEPGKTIIFYYWTTEEPVSDDIENVLVK